MVRTSIAASSQGRTPRRARCGASSESAEKVSSRPGVRTGSDWASLGRVHVRLPRRRRRAVIENAIARDLEAIRSPGPVSRVCRLAGRRPRPGRRDDGPIADRRPDYSSPVAPSAARSSSRSGWASRPATVAAAIRRTARTAPARRAGAQGSDPRAPCGHGSLLRARRGAGKVALASRRSVTEMVPLDLQRLDALADLIVIETQESGRPRARRCASRPG